MVVPVPGSTSRVSGLGIIGQREEAFSILEVISLVAGHTVSLLVIAGTLISNWHTDVVLVEGPSLGA